MAEVLGDCGEPSAPSTASSSPPPPLKRSRTDESSPPAATAAAPASASSSPLRQPTPARIKKGPIYITVAPQCAGKTTLLADILVRTEEKLSTFLRDDEAGDAEGKPDELQQQQQHSRVGVANMDVTIDDQPDVYIPVPTHLFLVEPPMQNQKLSIEDERTLNSTVQGKCVGRRLYSDDNAEMRAVLQRFAGVLSVEEFGGRLAQIYPDPEPQPIENAMRTDDNLGNHNSSNNNNNNNNNNATQNGGHQTRSKPNQRQQQQRDANNPLLRQHLFQAVEHLLADSSSLPPLPPMADVFAVESIFRAHPATNRTGLESAMDALEALSSNHTIHPACAPVAWGNTNTRPREFKTALGAAERSGRPVYFLVYGDRDDLGIVDKGLFLSPVGLAELVARNVRRLVETGRYVPVRAIGEAVGRVVNLAESARNELGKTAKVAVADASVRGVAPGAGGHTKFQLDQVLARMANYKMNADRTVTAMPAPNRSRNNRDNNGRNDGRARGGFGRGNGRGNGSSHGGQRNGSHNQGWRGDHTNMKRGAGGDPRQHRAWGDDGQRERAWGERGRAWGGGGGRGENQNGGRVWPSR